MLAVMTSAVKAPKIARSHHQSDMGSHAAIQTQNLRESDRGFQNYAVSRSVETSPAHTWAGRAEAVRTVVFSSIS